MQAFAIVVSLVLTVAAVALLVGAVRSMLGVIRTGQPAPGRTGNPGRRTVTMLKETVLHTRMLQWTVVGVMHWFVFAAFIFLSFAVLSAYFQLFSPEFAWPIIGHFYPYEWFSELIGVLSTVGIVYLIIYRQRNHPRSLGRDSRFFGSTFWQAYFVEIMALLEGAAILFIRGAEYNLAKITGHEDEATRAHFPIASWFGDALYPSSQGSEAALQNIIYAIAVFKIALAMVWLIVIARNLTMGIAWHRFTAWFNIWFKREDSGRTALGAMKPLVSAGKPVTLDDIDDLDEDAKLGVGSIEDFSWKGILDFTTCTECGRCQSQCPAWNTQKPLSPKHLVLSLRDHAYAAAPYLQAGETDGAGAEVAQKPLIGHTDQDGSVGAGDDVLEWFYNPADGGFVIDEDVLWSCTSCGACVQQCPVDIEHVDHIMDMRRYQVLVESNFPSELNGLFKGLENKGNPWNMSPSARLDWAKDLPFEVKVVGAPSDQGGIESLDEVDWLFWVGCAGAYEDRAKKTTRAVAELLDMAGVSFGVLGNGETCTGDPARRAGNEFVFQGLAQQNAETFNEYKVKKVVSTCAHCFNTLKNEYKDFGVELEVVHHTQLLNRLVREGKLTPVTEGAGAHQRSITYHDPCYIGRHNGVYSPPRELLQVLPGAEFKEMPRNAERSFCCGAGGARMWMEENLGSRINRNRTDEAVETGADQIAVGCPFCRVMLSDGLTAAQADGSARESVEVLDVAQMLLASVKGEMATKVAPGGGTSAAPAAAAASTALAAEPSAGDATDTPDTVRSTADAGPAAKASGGSSLFDTPAPESAPESAPDDASSLFDTPAPSEPSAPESTSGGSLFDEGGSLFDTPSTPAPAAPTEDEAAPATGGSLFDIPAETEAPEATAPAAEEAPAAAKAETPAQAEPDLGAGGSLFDIPAQTEAPATPSAEQAPEATAPAAEEAPPAAKAEAPAQAEPDLGAGGSLFDIPAPTEAPATPSAEQAPEATAPAAEEAPAAPVEAAPVAASGPVVASAPRTEVDIDSMASLFDIEAPGGAVTSAPAAHAVAAPVETPVDTPAEAPVEAPVEAPAAEAASAVDEQPADAPAPVREAPATVQAAAPATAPVASSGTASTPRTDVEIESIGSLFDIEAPAGAVAGAAPTGASTAAEPVTEPVAAEPVDAEPADEAADEPVEAPVETTVEPAGEKPEEPTEEPTEASRPAPAASSGEAHSPRTDVDISSTESLFDL
ncbi:hypothetical protein GCM10009798_02760 [Nocardioides panacihumi]|uniref:4Fe-4S ferredoxin-type domain-containing protein n=1 Tax=Nocardioides panacihumi TaxID=400774 RepID=A0ABN2Q9D7_9ACTN